jgi:hypothetical protein
MEGLENVSAEMNKLIVGQSFSRESEYRRCIFSFLTAATHLGKKKADVTFLLFTDHPAFFENWFQGLNIQYVELNGEKMKSFRGEIDFLHRMKIASIEEAFKLFPEHTLLYVDSDTFFLDDAMKCFDRVSTDTALMHMKEYEFSFLKTLLAPHWKTFQDFYRLISTSTFQLTNGKSVRVQDSDESWNAGVICLHPSQKHFLDDVYVLTDQFFPPTQHHASEQFAFSIILQKRVELLPCQDVIYHYWYRVKKRVMDEFLSGHAFLAMERADLYQKIKVLSKILPSLPNRLDSHFLILQDNAIQAFNEDKMAMGYRWYLKALLKKPFKSGVLTRDMAYHTKRYLRKTYS